MSDGSQSEDPTVVQVLVRYPAYLVGGLLAVSGLGILTFPAPLVPRLAYALFVTSAGLYALPPVRRRLPLPPRVTNYPSPGVTGYLTVALVVLALLWVGFLLGPEITVADVPNSDAQSATLALVSSVPA